MAGWHVSKPGDGGRWFVMLSTTFYLDAPTRTQDLLNTKWTLRGAGFSIGSTWHEGEGSSCLLTAEEHWNEKRLAQLRACDVLVVLSRPNSEHELAAMAGFALASGLSVVWIGSSNPFSAGYRSVQYFATAEEFQKHAIVSRSERPSVVTTALAA